MKTDAQIDALMADIPEQWRMRYCGGENGPCACLGCVYAGNKATISKAISGHRHQGDPEYISEALLNQHGAAYTDNKLTREEWASWMKRVTS